MILPSSTGTNPPKVLCKPNAEFILVDWDCCKASCGWPKKATLAAGSNPVTSCDKNDSPLANYDAPSACQSNGLSYMCSNQSPWAVSETLAYGFAATTISSRTEASWCCACYELTFTSGPVAGKKMVVQATNTGGDLGLNQFDLAVSLPLPPVSLPSRFPCSRGRFPSRETAMRLTEPQMPGGGFGVFNACTNQYGTPSAGWGAQYGGISSRSQCDAFPAKLKAGCYWRFDWFLGADNPAATFKQVTCPAALTAKSGCVRANDVIDEVPTGASSVATWTKTTMATNAATSRVTSAATSSKDAAPTVTTGTTIAKYGQCGGATYRGSTICVAGTICKFSSEYYSQCL